MADEERSVGPPWNDAELDAIVADYFSMLCDELAGTPYVKAQHRMALLEKIGRSPASVEFKHQNISAVLDELGMPWIEGYKPRRNFQDAIFDAIDRYLSANQAIRTRIAQPPGAPETAASGPGLFVQPPVPEDRIERPPRLEELVRKFDPVERDFRNRQLGRAGESFVVEVERARLARIGREDLVDRVRWVADVDGDGAGYDVLSFDVDGRERLIEVKTTNGGARTPFYLTRNEHDVSEARRDVWHLYRVHLFAQRPSIYTLSPPLAQALHLRGEIWRASFQ